MATRTGPTRLATGVPAVSRRSTGSGSGESILRIAGFSGRTHRGVGRRRHVELRLGIGGGRNVGQLGVGLRGLDRVLELDLDGLDRRDGRVVDQHRLLEVGHELVEQLGAHVGQHAAAELRHATGDGEVGGDGDRRALAIGREGGGDGGVGVALTAGLAALGPEHGHVLLGVEREELGLALVLGGDRPDLHLHDAAVLVALDLLELGAGEARGDALHVGEHGPCPLDRQRHAEVVGQLHRSRSSRVSMSSRRPSHGTACTSSGLRRISARAPSSPVSGRSGHTDRASRTGLPR